MDHRGLGSISWYLPLALGKARVNATVRIATTTQSLKESEVKDAPAVILRINSSPALSPLYFTLNIKK